MELTAIDPRMNNAPPDLEPLRDLPSGVMDFLLPLHEEFTERQRQLIAARSRVLTAAHIGDMPTYLPSSDATTGTWRIQLPEWVKDQRNQMTGPADDAELVVKMLNSGAPGVMIDLEDSMANKWPNLMAGHRNAVDALHGTLRYFDQKHQQHVGIRDSSTVLYVRVRGLHLSQAGIFDDGPVAAPLFDLAMLMPFFQNLRVLIPEICHRRGILAIGGMTALYPSRVDADLNARALAVLEKDKKNEADALMDGAWTGHPDQNEIAVAQFPYPNQLDKRPAEVDTQPDLRPIPEGVGRRTIAGSRAAARVTTLYRRGVLGGRGASLIDGYMEDLATDRIYRLMLTQRLLHSGMVPLAGDNGGEAAQDRTVLSRLYDEELAKLVALNPEDPGLLTRARQASEEMILNGSHTPV